MIFPAATNASKTSLLCTGPLDVCKTPSPGGPIPLPYPNLCMNSQAKGSTCCSKVKIGNKKTCTTATEISMSSGDEPGTAGGGIISSKFKGPGKYKKGSSKVKAGGKPVTHCTSLAGLNGSNANVPVGLHGPPSQTKTKIA